MVSPAQANGTGSLPARETTASDSYRAAERLARESYGRLLAFLVARTRDVAGAEDALAEAFASALATWPRDGVPRNPDAWLLTVARRRQTDAARRRSTQSGAEAHLKLVADEIANLAEGQGDIPDRRLALMFACAHPDIERAMRTPLILQTILGMTAAQTAAAFLVSPTSMGQRLVRAKARLADAAIPFRIPDREDLSERLDAVLDAVYAAYGRDWSDSERALASGLADEAIWLGQLVVHLLPHAPEAKGMLALMLYVEARRGARSDKSGRFVPLDQQDTALWDHRLVDRAETLLREASGGGPSGRYQIEAALQSAHTARLLGGADNWPAILSLYDRLLAMTGSPVALLNRAVPLAEVEGPRAALASLAPLVNDKRMVSYQPFWATRAHLCARAGDAAAAWEAYTLAIGLSSNAAVRAYLAEERSKLRRG